MQLLGKRDGKKGSNIEVSKSGTQLILIFEDKRRELV